MGNHDTVLERTEVWAGAKDEGTKKKTEAG